MRISIYIATSFDGYIARPNGDVDWLMKASAGEHEGDYGYQSFFSAIDCMVMGRKSFEKVLSFDVAWPYAGKRVIILSRTMHKAPADYADLVEFHNGTLSELVEKLEADQVKHLYIDGGRTIQAFLNAGLVVDMIVTTVPLLLGEGIPLFGSLKQDIPLKHVHTDSYTSGFVQSEYQIVKD